MNPYKKRLRCSSAFRLYLIGKPLSGKPKVLTHCQCMFRILDLMPPMARCVNDFSRLLSEADRRRLLHQRFLLNVFFIKDIDISFVQIRRVVRMIEDPFLLPENDAVPRVRVVKILMRRCACLLRTEKEPFPIPSRFFIRSQCVFCKIFGCGIDKV